MDSYDAIGLFKIHSSGDMHTRDGDSPKKTYTYWEIPMTEGDVPALGDIAFPSVFVPDTGGKIVYRSLDRTASRANVRAASRTKPKRWTMKPVSSSF
jgi:hypothetical protein